MFRCNGCRGLTHGHRGRCSLRIILCVFSVLGVEAVSDEIFPTALSRNITPVAAHCITYISTILRDFYAFETLSTDRVCA